MVAERKRKKKKTGFTGHRLHFVGFAIEKIICQKDMLQKTQGELSKLMDSELGITGVMVLAVRKHPSRYKKPEIPQSQAEDSKTSA